ncbi:MAG: MFS transporter [Gammaproteobacteria bacterium]|nr:MFS transporter [Gammaproteobacteria bacterium]
MSSIFNLFSSFFKTLFTYRRGAIICALASLFYVYDYFIQVSPAVITQALMQDFSIGAAGLGILGSCFFYAYAGMQIPVGVLLDQYGARRLLSFAIFISGLGVLLFGLTHDFSIACLSRLMVGFGSAFSFVGTLFLVARWFPHRYFAFTAGLVQLAGCIGSIFGEAPLASVMNHYGWRPTMIGIGLLTFGLTLIFWLVIRDQAKNYQAHHPKQCVKPTTLKMILKNDQVLWLAALGFVCWIPVATLGALWGIPYLMEVFQLSNTESGNVVSVFWIALGLSSPLFGALSDKIKRRKPIFYVCFLMGIFGALLLILAPTVGLPMTLIGILLIGLCPAIQSLTFAVAKDFLPKEIFGAASGIINMAPIVGGALAQLFVGLMLEFFWTHTFKGGTPFYDVVTYQKSMSVLLIACVVGLVITHFKLKESYPDVSA